MEWNTAHATAQADPARWNLTNFSSLILVNFLVSMRVRAAAFESGNHQYLFVRRNHQYLSSNKKPKVWVD
ncbi:hypothetical protein SESBI_03323 [Sesbania bispinosa]|nr:hypothetical protein SESBI_03323 [Sesbania bispinosa]